MGPSWKNFRALAVMLLIVVAGFAAPMAFAETGSTLVAGDLAVQSDSAYVSTESSVRSLSDAKVGKIADETYNAMEHTPIPTVKYGSKQLKKGSDFKVSYRSNVNAGTASVVITGKGRYTGTVKKTFRIKAASISGASVDSISDRKYTGSAIKPAPTVTFRGLVLQRGKDYQLSYSNNKNPGVAKVIVRGMGNFSGKKVVTFRIKKASSGGGGTVYITRTGKKFHRSGCSSLSKSRIAISRSQAITKGYTPCKRCKP